MVITRLQALVLLISLALASFVQASNFGIPSSGIKLIDVGTTSSDLIAVNAPNASGVSYNYIPTVLIDKPVKILNTAEAYPGKETLAAKLIIIRADAMQLNSSIELVGEKADILLITPLASSLMACTNCSFTNWARVTFAAASTSPALTSATTVIGTLTPTTNGQVAINNLSAAGVDSLEFIANAVTTSGLINTQQRAKFNAAGGYEIAADGGFIVGSGGVNIYAKGLSVDYETLNVTKVVESSIPTVLGAKITSAAIRVTTASVLQMSGELSTQSDILASTAYRNVFSPTQEAIELKTLAIVSGNIFLNAPVKSDFNFVVQSSGNLYLNNNVGAKNIDLTVRGKIFNTSAITTTKASVVADQFENNGKITTQTIKVVAERDIQNRFGGKILADNISLISDKSFVRNGSQYPFAAASESALVLNNDVTKLSTMGEFALGGTKVADLSAKIVGRNITIGAYSNVENINPYFIYTKDPLAWANGVIFDTAAIDRVVLIAEDSLNIQANQYVVNSSAIMGVNATSNNKNFVIDAPNISNERYFTRVLADVVTGSSAVVTGNTTVVNSSTGLQANLYVYSPPGIIYSFAATNFNMANSTAGFINNTAYFEIFNNMYFTGAGTVSSIGLTLEKENYSFATSTIVTSQNCYSYSNTNYNSYSNTNYNSYNNANMSCNYAGSSSGTSAGTTVTNDVERTLFSISGDVYGKKSDFFAKNHQALDDIKASIINDYINANSSYDFYDALTTGQHWDVSISRDVALSADGKKIILTQTESYFDSPNISYDYYESPPQNYTTKQEVNLWDLLVKKLAEIKTAFLAALDAFIAWWK
jgi:hypothetical protein